MTTKLANPPLDCISRIRFAPQKGSNHLLVASWDAHVRLYDVSTGLLTGMHKQAAAVLDCCFVHDSSRFFSVGLDKRLLLFDFQRQQELAMGQHEEAIRCVEFHGPTQLVLTGSWDRTVKAWDPRRPMNPATTLAIGAKVFCLDVGKDKLAIGGSDRNVHIYDTRNMGAPMEKRESSLKHQIRSLKIGIDQRSYASSSVEGRCAIEYFDPRENTQLRYAFKCHRVKEASGSETVHPVNALAYHPTHGTFATGGSDGGVCVWDGYAKKRLWRLNPFDTSISSLAFSADGQQLAIGVSYTFDHGERVPAPQTEVAVRQISDSEVLPKSQQQ
mmetsp:Transcript_44978/g.101183  ORF Transcript_44978/g.101183 Transcript_44978/m.101183 type:complete len:329 (+) Transcript_44978:104-1090(+)